MQAAEQLFNEGLRHTKALIYHRPGKTWIWGGAKLLPDEIIGELKQRGITITRRTLLNWEKADWFRGHPGQLWPRRGQMGRLPRRNHSSSHDGVSFEEVYQLKNADIAEARKGFDVSRPSSKTLMALLHQAGAREAGLHFAAADGP